MDQYDFNKVGDRICNMVDKAVDSKDYAQLNQSIQKAIREATNGLNRIVYTTNQKTNQTQEKNSKSVTWEQTKTGQWQEGTSAPHPAMDSQTIMRNNARWQAPVLYQNTTGMKFSGGFQSIFGYIFAIAGGTAAISSLIPVVVGHMTSGIVGFLGSLLFLGIGVGCIVGGTKKLGLAKRFENYKMVLGQKTVVTLEQLSRSTGKSIKYVTEDVQNMISNRMFPQGHMDEERTSLMITDNAYQQYLEVKRSQIEVKKEEEKLEQSDLPSEAKEIIKEGNQYLEKIRFANDHLPGDTVSEKLEKLENVIRRILEVVKKQPSSANELRKLMNYYLPTTWKLINAYMEVEKEPVKTPKMIETQKEIEETLDTINAAFENLLDDLFQKQAWDISSDISVLNTMFVQEGLKKGSMDIHGDENPQN